MLTDCVCRELGKGRTGTTAVCSTKSGASSRRLCAGVTWPVAAGISRRFLYSHRAEGALVVRDSMEAVNQNTSRKPLQVAACASCQRGSWVPTATIPTEPDGSESQRVTSSIVTSPSRFKGR